MNIGSSELKANPNVKQIIEVVREEDKRSRLVHHLNSVPMGDRIIIFTQTKVWPLCSAPFCAAYASLLYPLCSVVRMI